jgi:hypothetical protein
MSKNEVFIATTSENKPKTTTFRRVTNSLQWLASAYVAQLTNSGKVDPSARLRWLPVA